MAVLTEDKIIKSKAQSVILENGLAAGVKLYRGAMVKVTAPGYLAPIADEVGAKMAGVNTFQSDNTGGLAGDVYGRYWTQGIFLLTGSGLTQADIGSDVYALDDQTITTTAATHLKVGSIVAPFVSATEAWVQIDGATE